MLNNKMNIPSPDFELECQVLGSVFLDDEAAVHTFSTLVPDDFGNSQIRSLYKATLERFQNGLSFDAMSVTEDFGTAKNEMRRFLYQIAQSVISTDNYKEHCRLVKTEAARRRMTDISAEAMEYSTGNYSMTEMQTFLADRLELFDNCNTRKSETAVSGIQYFLDHADETREYIKTGISPIDNCLKISKGDYIVMGARPSVGKTAFALQIGWHMSTEYNVVFFSFETSTQKIFDRIISNQFWISFPKIIENNLSISDKEQIRLGLKIASKNKFTVVEASGMTVSEMQAEAVRLKADVIFIDYIGLVSTSDDVVVSEYEKVTKISKDLHTMAQKRKIAVFALSQLSRGGEETPTMSTLRSSGQIEADADSVLLMSREKNKQNPQDENIRLIQVAKNKCGELGKIYMSFSGEYQKFLKLDNPEEIIEERNYL